MGKVFDRAVEFGLINGVDQNIVGFYPFLDTFCLVALVYDENELEGLVKLPKSFHSSGS